MGATDYEISEDAALTILLHASKHPSCAVGGALLGGPAAGGGAGGGGVAVAAAVPLFHRSHVMAPCVEAALTQAEAAAAKRGLSLIGYYHADYKFAPAEVGPLTKKIADKIADRTPGAALLLLDNVKLAAFSGAPAAAEAGAGAAAGGAAGAAPPLELLLREAGGGGGGRGAWKRVQPGGGGGGGLAAGGGGWDAVQKRYLNLFAAGRHRDLADFDEHLDDLGRDFLNDGLLAGSELLAR